MKSLNLAPQLSIPVDAVTQTFAILGIRGSGKTSTAVVMVEELLKASQQVVILDPVDVWFGLRSAAGGKSSGFPVTILGGDHADLPLEANSGTIIADFVVDSGASLVLSLRHMSMNDQRRFAADFAERLYARKGEGSARSPLHLVIDEADAFVPQRIPPGGERMFGAFDRIVRRGRAAGLGVTMISQRAQIINKDVLSQIETLICHRVLHKLDRKALEAWIEAHDVDGKSEEFLQSLAALGRGDAWVWSPEWLGIFKRVHIRARETFDSSSTPKAGEKREGPKKIAAVDLDELRTKLAATIERAKADNPAELRRQVGDLKAQLAKVSSAPPKTELINKEAIEKRIAAAVEKAELRTKTSLLKMFRAAHADATKLHQSAGALAETLRTLEAAASEASQQLNHLADERDRYIARAAAASSVRSAVPTPSVAAPRKPMATASASSERLPEGEFKILTACAQHESTGCDRTQLTVLTGYKRSTRDAYLQRLSQKGFVSIEGQTVRATNEGIDTLGDSFKPLPKGRELQDYWLNKLPSGESALLRILIERYPGAVDRHELTELTGFQRSTRDAYLQRLGAKKLISSTPGMAKASGVLF